MLDERHNADDVCNNTDVFDTIDLFAHANENNDEGHIMNPDIAQRILDAGNAIDDERRRFWYVTIAETLIDQATETPDDVDTFIHHIREDAIRNDGIERFVEAMRGEICDYIMFDPELKGFVCMLVESQTEVLVQLTAI